MFKVRIIHKGIALALIPLAINTIWIGLLSSSLTKADALVKQERAQTVILTHINKTATLVANSFGELVSYAWNGNELHKSRTEDLNAKAIREFEILDSLTKDDFRIRPWLKQLTDTLTVDMKILSDLSAHSDGQSMNLIENVKKTRRLVKQAANKNLILMKILQEKELQLDKIRQQETQADEYVRNVVLYGLLSNFVIALLLILFFVKDVTTRLSILVENAHLLPKHVPLKRRVTGQDELSELDAEIHAAGAQLIESAEYRRGLMQMMAHDLRSPLASCMVSLEMLGETEGEIQSSRKETDGSH